MGTPVEVNFDGLVGPTHNYAGLALGNMASQAHAGRVSSPRRAALEGLDKMEFLLGLGQVQGVLPPQSRPKLAHLAQIGFDEGSDATRLERAYACDPALVAQCYSASSMWTANAATVIPSTDSRDGRLHLLPANLCASMHRSLEASDGAAMLRRIFPGSLFQHHLPLPAQDLFADEGAANHMRLAAEGTDGVARTCHVFVYGRANRQSPSSRKVRPRQTRAASEAAARTMRLATAHSFVEQSAEAVDAGVFHNDVIALSHGSLLLYHDRAYENETSLLAELRQHLGESFLPIRFDNRQLPLEDAIASYLFNSQILTLPGDRGWAFLAPQEAAETASAKACLQDLLTGENPISELHFVDVRESMRNGGGPACLRLRIPMTEAELAAVHQPCILNGEGIEKLRIWVRKHYRDRLSVEDLRDPQLVSEVRGALDELTKLLELGNDFYDFQRSRTA